MLRVRQLLLLLLFGGPLIDAGEWAEPGYSEYPMPSTGPCAWESPRVFLPC